MRILGLETSSRVFSVAVCEGDRILSALKSEDPVSRSDRLADLIQQALKDSGTPIKALEGLAISMGPGSFTGLRVGVATAKTLAWALKKPVLPVSSLEVIASNLSQAASPIGVLLDARKGKVYTACFSPDGSGGLRRLSEDQLLLPEAAIQKIPSGALLTGDGVERYAGLLVSCADRKITVAAPQSWIPSAENLCRIAAAQGLSRGVDDPHRLVPQYLYSKESDVIGW